VPAEAKVEHLKFVQAVVNRMAANSFLLKGWTVTLVAGLFAFGAKEGDRVFVLIAWIPVVVFAGLDAYYLRQERLFRHLHARVAAKPGTDAVDYAMEVAEFRPGEPWLRALGSKTVLCFYAPVALILAGLTLYFALSPRGAVTPVQGLRTITISIQ